MAAGNIVRLGLVALLAAQGILILYKRVVATRWLPLEVGMALPYEIRPLAPLADDRVDTEGRSCHVAFVCTTECPYCAELATRVSGLTLGPGAVRGAFFISHPDEEAVSRWAQDHGLDYSSVAQILPLRSGLFSSVFGYVWGTPFRVIYDSEARIRDARPSDVIPSAIDFGRLCEDGGISPKSLEELQEYFADSIPRGGV
jgi:hypothetical protein